MEQKFYRSKSVPSPDQVQRLEDCTQDYGPNDEERLEYVETVDAPLEELIKEDQSHRHVVSQRLPQGHGEWDHELAVYEEDGGSGLLEDRTLTVRAGDHPFGMNQFNEVAEDISARIAKFFAEKEENHIRTRELSLSVHPVYHQSNGDAYTSFGMSRSKSMGSVAHEAHQTSNNQHSSETHGTASSTQSRPRLDQVSSTTKSLSNLFSVDTRHDYNSRYGNYVSGYGHYGTPLPPAKNQEVMPKMPAKKSEHIYDEPIHRTSTTNVYSSTYERKYDFKTTFPPEIEMPEGYHDYYDPSKFMFLDAKGYYQGNITRPLHYSYSRDYLEKYSDYDGTSRLPSPAPPKTPEPAYTVLNRSEDLPHHPTHLSFSFPDYYDHATQIILSRDPGLEHIPYKIGPFADYYDNVHRIILSHTKDLDHCKIVIPSFPDYYDLSTRYEVLHRVEDILHEPIVIEEYPAYCPYEDTKYEVQEKSVTLDDEHIYEEVYEPPLPPLPPPAPPIVVHVLNYTRDHDHIVFVPLLPYIPPPPPPPAEIIHVATPAEVIEEEPEPVPVPAKRHYDDLYIGNDALDVSVSPHFNQSNDQKNLGLEKSVTDRVREMERAMRGEERERLLEEEKRRKYLELQNEIKAAREYEEEHAYEEIQESKNTPCPVSQPILIPSVFVPVAVPEPIPEKPKRTWQPPPKSEEFLDEHIDKPLGPVIFHELIYRNGFLLKMNEENHILSQTRPVSHPVSRANSRPTTPGLEIKTIDFPRLDDAASPRDHSDSAGNVDYVHKHIERYNAKDASVVQDSHDESRAHSHMLSNTVQTHTHSQLINQNQATHYDAYATSQHSNAQEYSTVHGSQTHRGSVVYDEPHGQVVYDIPHDQEHHHYDTVHVQHHHHHHYHTDGSEHVHHYHQDENAHQHSTAENEHIHHYHTTSNENAHHHHSVQNEKDIQYQLAQSNQSIRQMSKTNNWDEQNIQSSKRAHIEAHIPVNSPFVKREDSRVSTTSHVSTASTATTTGTVVQCSNSLNRQNIPAPLKIQNGNSESYHEHNHHQHVHFDSVENSENIAHQCKSTTSLDYQPVHVGHVKNLAKLFNKPDEKPLTTEQVIYRVSAAPPGHHLEPEIKPRPRSLPRIPLDEIELHEHGSKDHMTRHHHEMHQGTVDEHSEHGYSIGGGAQRIDVSARTSSTVMHSPPVQVQHNSYYHRQSSDEESIRVRRVYKALDDTSMLSPVSLSGDGPNF